MEGRRLITIAFVATIYFVTACTTQTETEVETARLQNTATLTQAVKPISPEVPAIKSTPDSIGTLTRVRDLIFQNESQVSGTNDVFQNDYLHVFEGGEGLLDFGSDMRLRMFNDTELGGVLTYNDPSTPLIVKMTLFCGGFTGQLFCEGGNAEFDTPNGARIHVSGTQFLLTYDPNSEVAFCANFEGDMSVQSEGSELIAIPAGEIFKVFPGEEPVFWAEIPWSLEEFEELARINQSPYDPIWSINTTTPTITQTP